MPLKKRRERRLCSERLEPRIALAVDGFAEISGLLVSETDDGSGSPSSTPLQFEQVELYRDTDQDGAFSSLDVLLNSAVADESGRYSFKYLGAGEYLVRLPNQAGQTAAISVTTTQAFGSVLGYVDTFLAAQSLGADSSGGAFSQGPSEPDSSILGLYRDLELFTTGNPPGLAHAEIESGLFQFSSGDGLAGFQLVYDGEEDSSAVDSEGLLSFTSGFVGAAGLRFGLLGQGGTEELSFLFTQGSDPSGESVARTVTAPQSLVSTNLQTVVVPFLDSDSTEPAVEFGGVGAISLGISPSEPGFSLQMSEIEIVGFSSQQANFTVVATDLGIEIEEYDGQVQRGAQTAIKLTVTNYQHLAQAGAMVQLRVTDTGANGATVFFETIPLEAIEGGSSEEVIRFFTPQLNAVGPLEISAVVISADQDTNSQNDTATSTLELIPRSSLSGVVYVDSNGNGQLDEGEQGIPGVKIQISSIGYIDLVDMRETTTDADGVYRFDNVLRDVVYSLQEVQPDQYADGEESVGTALGVLLPPDGFLIRIGLDNSSVSGFNFGELPIVDEPSIEITPVDPPEIIDPPPPPAPPNRLLQRGFFSFTSAPQPRLLSGGGSNLVDTPTSLGSTTGAVSPVLTERAADDLDLDLLLDNLLDFMAPDVLPIDLGDAPPSSESPQESERGEEGAGTRSSSTAPGGIRQAAPPAEPAGDTPAPQEIAVDEENSPVAVLALAGVAIGVSHAAQKSRRKQVEVNQ